MREYGGSLNDISSADKGPVEVAAGSGSAVFISYASRDAAVADVLCRAVERAGLPCWIAPRNVRPGDLYADAIVRAINACTILVLVLSESSIVSGHVLREVERASAKSRPIISFRIDSASLPPALEYFLSASHWLDASGGNVDRALPMLIEALRSHFEASSILMMKPGAAPGISALPDTESKPAAPMPRPKATPLARAIVALAAVIALMLAYFIADKYWLSRRTPPLPPLAAERAAFAPPPHSVAVLPFVNMSGDPDQEYFSDGLSEELLNSLAAIHELQVAARTSSFSFKGDAGDLAVIARKLNVGAILEGSIRKDGKQIRITAQLIDALSGFQLWSNSYDRSLKDILKLQTEIATAVTAALKAKLLPDTAAVVELGGTQDPRAFDAYLQGERFVGLPLNKNDMPAQLAAYDEAIRLDPRFAKAYVAKALAQMIFGSNFVESSAVRGAFEQARASAERAVALAPELGEAHAVLGFVLDVGYEDYSGAANEHERALALSPGNSRVLLTSARFLAEIGRAEAAVTDARRAVVLDPLNAGAYRLLGLVLLYTHHYREAILAYDRALTINPQSVQAAANRGLAQAALGNLESSRQSCATPPLDWLSHMCLAIVLNKLNRPADAQAELAALRATATDQFDLAYQYAQIYAQWGDAGKALDWLETAQRVRDPGLVQIKVDALLDPIRHEPRFEAVLKSMKFPD